jgi:hypothetical protein
MAVGICGTLLSACPRFGTGRSSSSTSVGRSLLYRDGVQIRVGSMGLTLDLVEGSVFWVWRARCAVLVRCPGTVD